MDIRKTLFKTIICLSTVFLLAACDDDDNDKPQTTVTSKGLNCSSARGTYTVTKTIEADGDKEATTETTTIDIGSTCSFSLHSETLGSASGTLTSVNGHTYTGTGTSKHFCRGAFDFSIIVNDNAVSYVLECR